MRFAASNSLGAGVEVALGLGAHVLQIGLHLARPFDAADGTVPGNDDLRVERDDAIERRAPVGDAALPADRGAEAEQNVAGENHPLLGQVHDDVADGVRRTDVDELDRKVRERQVETIFEQSGRRRQHDVGEVVLAQGGGKLRQRRVVAGSVADRLHQLGALLGEGFGAQAMADDLGALEELVAPAVIAVVVRVDDATAPARAKRARSAPSSAGCAADPKRYRSPSRRRG